MKTTLFWTITATLLLSVNALASDHAAPAHVDERKPEVPREITHESANDAQPPAVAIEEEPHEAPKEAVQEQQHEAAEAENGENKTLEKPTGEKEPKKPSFMHKMWNAFWQPLDKKLTELRYLDEQNETLRRQVAELEAGKSALEYRRRAEIEARNALAIKAVAKKEGGVEHSRTIASIKVSDAKFFKRPPRLIFEDALNAFNDGDYAKAAKVFVFLADNPDNDAYQNARTFYLAGVSLYKIHNYKKALTYFELVTTAGAQLKGERVPASDTREFNPISYAPKAMAWMALCFDKLGDKVGGQKIVHKLIQKFPKSIEARRLNR